MRTSSQNITPGPGEAGGVDRPADELLSLAGAAVERGDALGGDASRPLSPVGRVVVQQHAPLAPVEHVDDDHHVARARQVGGDAPARVVLPLEVGQDGVLVGVLDELLLAPEVEPAVVVQGDDAGRGEAGSLRESSTKAGTRMSGVVLKTTFSWT